MRDGDGFRVRIERCGDGYCARGPGFYAWDDDARTLLDALFTKQRSVFWPVA